MTFKSLAIRLNFRSELKFNDMQHSQTQNKTCNKQKTEKKTDVKRSRNFMICLLDGTKQVGKY
ncbi:hypothetical protein E2C01_075221 [Portunus trituberculatus]|uniref:Uncharacterized protein n=1 Tax=Portunus trituberculatus TaxID=210409 RepID=A0A5B7IF97_PORTR|nr:hypothetical protein [Portunus trituberculatus]